MKNYKVYKLLIITLLLSVSVFCYLYLNKINNQKVEVSTEVMAEEEKNNVEEAKEEIFYNTLPKQPVKTEEYVIQNIGGTKSEKFCASYEVKGYTYVIFESTSNDYDVITQKRSVCVAKLNNMILESVLTLQNDEDVNYVDSKIFDSGFYILTNGENKSSLYEVNFDNINIKKIEKSSVSNSLFYLENALLMISNANDLFTITLIENFEIVKEYSAYIENIIDYFIFERSGKLDIFINCNNSYNILSFDTISGFTTSKTTFNTNICEIIPFNDGYAGIMKHSSTYYVFTADNNFSNINNKILGNSGYFKIIPYKDNLLLYRFSDNKGLLTLYCKHLDIVIENETESIENILYIDYSNLKIVGYFDKKISVYNLENYNFVLDYSFYAENKKVNILSSNTICYTSNFLGNDMFRNYGESDVFLVKQVAKN